MYLITNGKSISYVLLNNNHLYYTEELLAISPLESEAKTSPDLSGITSVQKVEIKKG